MDTLCKIQFFIGIILFSTILCNQMAQASPMGTYLCLDQAKQAITIKFQANNQIGFSAPGPDMVGVGSKSILIPATNLTWTYDNLKDQDGNPNTTIFYLQLTLSSDQNSITSVQTLDATRALVDSYSSCQPANHVGSF